MRRPEGPPRLVFVSALQALSGFLADPVAHATGIGCVGPSALKDHPCGMVANGVVYQPAELEPKFHARPTVKRHN
jgi:hypothetical protein